MKFGYSVVEAAEAAGISRSMLYQEIMAGRLRAVKVGRRTLVLAADLQGWLATRPSIFREPKEGARQRATKTAGST